jgi:choline dehydrogenase-like flavoprotein
MTNLPPRVITGQSVEKDITLRCQVVIAGSGAGGSTAAAELSERGIDVVVLEEGGYHPTESFSSRVTKMIPRLWRNSGLNPMLGKPSIPFVEGRCVGGGTVINGALMWRTPDETLEQYNIEGMNPESMTPYFEKVEDDLSIKLHKDEAGYNNASRLLLKGAKQFNWKCEAAPRAQHGCQNSNFCPTGCPTGGKQSMLVAYIPRALQAGAHLYADCQVDKVQFKDGKACGILGRIHNDHLGRRFDIRIDADHVILAGGPVQTPLMLLRSGVRRQVGHNLRIQPNVKMAAFFDEPVDAHYGTMMTAQVKEFAGSGYTIGSSNTSPIYTAMTLAPHWEQCGEMMNYWRNAALYIALVRAKGAGRVRRAPIGGQALLSYKLNPSDVECCQQAFINTSKALLAAGAHTIVGPIKTFPIVKSNDDLELLEKQSLAPGDLDLMTVHAMSSCRMAADKGSGVTDPWGRVWDIPNLHIADASILPDAPGVNPQETIMATVLRNMDKLGGILA